ncbi:hypothetical protein ACRJ4B_16140 [Streptomyces sp. GTA36]
MSPREFWDLTPRLLLSLAEQHQAANQTGGNRPDPAMQQSAGPGLFEMAHMQHQ